MYLYHGTNVFNLKSIRKLGICRYKPFNSIYVSTDMFVARLYSKKYPRIETKVRITEDLLHKLPRTIIRFKETDSGLKECNIEIEPDDNLGYRRISILCPKVCFKPNNAEVCILSTKTLTASVEEACEKRWRPL